MPLEPLNELHELAIDASQLTQEAFGQLVGISQPAVSYLMKRGVIQPGDSGLVWLQAYCAHLREQAAARGSDGKLVSQRARLAREQADALAMKNEQMRRELVPTELAEAALAYIGRQVALRLEEILPRLQQRATPLPAGVVPLVQEQVARACHAAATVSLIDAEQHDDEEEPLADEEQAPPPGEPGGMSA